ncbi:MAG: hypothetical protein U0Q15_05670 [Kineosporiaceae bacterium]
MRSSPPAPPGPARASRTRRGVVVAALAGLTASGVLALPQAALAAGGTALFSQTFRDSTVSPTGGDVKLLAVPAGSGSNVACLTASSTTTQRPVPGCGGTPDAVGAGALRLTAALNNQVGAVMAATSVPTANGLDISFDTYQYGGSGADGIAFVLAAVDPKNPQSPANTGPLGGSLGYSATPSLSGFSYGYLGIGLDVYGNYSNNQFAGNGCPQPSFMTWGVLHKNQVVVRGPGSGTTGYCGISSTYGAYPGGLAMRGSTRANSKVPVHIVIDAVARTYTVQIVPIGGSTTTLSGTLPSAVGYGFPADWLDANGLPKQLAFGWVAATGGANDVHDVNVSADGVTTVKSVTAAPVLTGAQRYVGSRSANGTGTLTVTSAIGPDADENKPVSVTSTLPGGMTPTGGSGTGWSCAAPTGQTITCTTTGSTFSAGQSLSALTISTRNGGANVSDGIIATGKATVSSDDASPALVLTTVAPLPPAPALSSSGRGIAVQTVAVPVPAGGSATLVDGSGTPVGSLTVAGKGTYTYADGVISLQPVLGFTGSVSGARYRVTDADGQTATGAVTSVVNAPEAPVATPVTTTGAGTAVQRFTAVKPAGGAIALDGATGTSTQTLVVNGQGTYVLDRASGEVTFTPVLGYLGAATPATYRLTDAYGTSSTSTYTPTVIVPDGPDAAALSSSGTGVAVQTVAPAVPASGQLALLDGLGAVQTQVTMAGQGTYRVSGSSLTFTPVNGFAGLADPVTYRVTDAYASTGAATYTARVDLPPGPHAGPLGTTGVGTDAQHVDVLVPAGGSVSLLDGGSPASTVTVPGKGVFTVAGTRITFAPVLGYLGDDATVAYRVSDAYAQHADSVYTPTVTVPAGPDAAARTSTGIATAVQTTTPSAPEGGSVEILDAAQAPSSSVTLQAGEGTYAIDGSYAITFTPVLGFDGPAVPVTYQLTDAYGQTSRATYTPRVEPPAPPAAEPRTAALVDPSGSGTSPQAFDVAALVPAGGRAQLLTAAKAPVASLVVAGQGTWTLSTSGAGTFAPLLGFAGPATPVTYRITDAYGQTATAPVDATVKAPDALTVPLVTSTGVADDPQSMLLLLPEGGQVWLFDGWNTSQVSVPGEGDYELDPGTGVVTFTPVLGFAGEATPVGYRVRDSYGTWSNVASVIVTVELPSPPAPTGITTSGEGTALQQATLPAAPAGGSRGLVGSSPQVVAGQGTYTWDGDGTLSFVPQLGFTGAATPATFRLTDAYGQIGEATWTPSVTPPAPPSAPARTSTGAGTADQVIVLIAPTGGSARLVDGDGHPATALTASEGAYVLDPSTGTVTFTPVLGFTGTAAAVGYRYTDAYAQATDGTITATVTVPTGPVAGDRTSSATGTAGQSLTLSVPTSGTVTLVDGDGADVTSLVVDHVGTWTLDPGTHVLSFAPVLGFAGPAQLDYRVRDAYGTWSAAATVTATVLPPAPPVVTDVTSSGTGTTTQSPVLVAPPVGGSITLLDADGDEVDELAVDGEGSYELDPATHAVTFRPALGFVGTASAVRYRVTDAYGQSREATITATVLRPAAPSTPTTTPISTPPGGGSGSGGSTRSRSVSVEVPDGGAVTLLDPHGTPVTDLVIPGKGTYHLDAVSGVITFVPFAGFSGAAPAVTFRVSDAYGQTATGTFAALVPAATPPARVGLSMRSLTVVGSDGWVRPLCTVAYARITGCTVTLKARVGRSDVVLGTGRIVLRPTRDGQAATAMVRLTGAGRALAGRPGGVLATATASVSVGGRSTPLPASTRTRLVAARVAAAPVFFTTGSSRLDRGDLRQLATLRGQLAGVRTVTCVGSTDSIGRDRPNVSLGRARASAACRQLTHGLRVAVVVRTVGEHDPRASNRSARGRAFNRRSDVILGY